MDGVLTYEKMRVALKKMMEQRDIVTDCIIGMNDVGSKNAWCFEHGHFIDTSK